MDIEHLEPESKKEEPPALASRANQELPKLRLIDVELPLEDTWSDNILAKENLPPNINSKKEFKTYYTDEPLI